MRKICFVLFIVTVALGFATVMQRSMANQDDPSSARDNLLQANNSMIQAFVETQKANSAGADVSILKENLTIVQDFLENARIAYDEGEFSTSIESSQQAVSLSNEIIAEAIKLTIKENERPNVARYTTIAYFAVVDFSICVVGLYAINKIYKRRHDEFLKKRPKVGDVLSG